MSKSLRSEVEVIHQQLIGPIKRRCVDALFGNDGAGIRLALVTDIEEMRAMTKCEEYPHGLDFSSEEHTARVHLYEMRDELQEEYNLFFRGERRIGLRWTVYAPRGLAWRIEEWFERCDPMVHQIAGWCGIEAARTGNQELAQTIQRVGEMFRNTGSEMRQIHAKTDGMLTATPGAILGNRHAA